MRALFLTSSPTGTYRSEEPLNYTGFNPANGMVEELKRYWKDPARCLLISAFPDEYAIILFSHRSVLLKSLQDMTRARTAFLNAKSLRPL